MQGASGGASKGKVMTSTGGPSALMGGANGLHLNSPAQLNPVGTLALPIQISERYLGTYFDIAPHISDRASCCRAGSMPGPLVALVLVLR